MPVDPSSKVLVVVDGRRYLLIEVGGTLREFGFAGVAIYNIYPIKNPGV
jgi:hypothetical protein